MPTLVIVDMQHEFDTANDNKLICNIAKKVRSARALNWHVVVLEFQGFGGTFDEIKKALVGYRRYRIVKKREDDGSAAIKRLRREFRFDKEEFYVCGVNIDCCVRRTCEGLTSVYPDAKILVVRGCCNNYGLPAKQIMRWTVRHRNICRV